MAATKEAVACGLHSELEASTDGPAIFPEGVGDAKAHFAKFLSARSGTPDEGAVGSNEEAAESNEEAAESGEEAAESGEEAAESGEEAAESGEEAAESGEEAAESDEEAAESGEEAAESGEEAAESDEEAAESGEEAAESGEEAAESGEEAAESDEGWLACAEDPYSEELPELDENCGYQAMNIPKIIKHMKSLKLHKKYPSRIVCLWSIYQNPFEGLTYKQRGINVTYLEPHDDLVTLAPEYLEVACLSDSLLPFAEAAYKLDVAESTALSYVTGEVPSPLANLSKDTAAVQLQALFSLETAFLEKLSVSPYSTKEISLAGFSAVTGTRRILTRLTPRTLLRKLAYVKLASTTTESTEESSETVVT